MMRWIVVGLLVVMAAVAVFKRSQPWKGEDLGAALQTAAVEKKPVVAVVGAEWCVFCHKFQEQTLPDGNVQKSLSDWEVVLVDGDSESGKKVVDRYQVGGLPTILFLKSTGEEVHRVVGFADPNAFLVEIEVAEKSL